MGFLKNKYVLILGAAVLGFIAYRWWQGRQLKPATPGAAAKAAG